MWDFFLPGSWCTLGRMNSLAGISTGRSRTPCTPDYCWLECCVPPDRDVRSSSLTDTSCQTQYRAAYRLTGSEWTGHRLAGEKHKEGCMSENARKSPRDGHRCKRSQTLLHTAHTYSQERIQSSVLHKLSEDHDGTAGCYNALQVDDVGVLELAHDWRFWQEVPPLLVCVSTFEGLDGHVVFFLTRDPQASPANLAKLAWRWQTKGFDFRIMS